MNQSIFYQPIITEGIQLLDEEESRHCIKVLRKKPGDLIRLTDGKGYFYDAIIVGQDQRQCAFEITDRIEVPAKGFFVHIAISPTKNPDRIEWFVEKAVEIGVDRITIMSCENSEKSFLKTDRLKKVSISAMKQSLRATLPEILGTTPFYTVATGSAGSQKFIAHVDESNTLHLKDAAKKNNNCLVLIGPEGDFSPAELSLAKQNGFQKVSLGNSRLRTETAGLAACFTISLINS